MKNCPTCGAQLDDAATFCTQCGYNFAMGAGGPQAYAPADPFDHTAEYDPKDISDNKVLAMLVYLFGLLGVILVLLSGNSSPYAQFHMRQSLKMLVCLALLTLVNIIPILGQIAFAVGAAIIFVLMIIAFFQVCKGQAKEPAIIKNLKFLK